MAKKSESDRPKGKARVLLVDDHPILRQGLGELINEQQDMAVCGEAASAHAALKEMASSHPDVAIVDISLKEGNGIELIKDVQRRHDEVRILVLSMHDETLYAERALRAGARGYIMKEAASDSILTAIRQVLRGEVYLSDRMVGKLLNSVVGGAVEADGPPVNVLSDRELEVFLLIGQGLGTRQIAEKLHLSVKTIESYRAQIRDKLKLADGNELLQYAIEWGKGHE